MDEDHDTTIVSRLKDPWKFLFVDMDIAMLGSTIGIALLMAGLNTFIVMAVPGLIGYWVHKARQDRPRGYVRHLCYWYLPPVLSRLQRTPPMYCIRTVG